MTARLTQGYGPANQLPVFELLFTISCQHLRPVSLLMSSCDAITEIHLGANDLPNDKPIGDVLHFAKIRGIHDELICLGLITMIELPASEYASQSLIRIHSIRSTLQGMKLNSV